MDEADDPEPEALEELAKLEPPADARIPDHLRPFMTAWQRLQHDRLYSSAGTPFQLSFLSLDTYARRYGIEDEEFELFEALVRALDAEYVSFMVSRAQAASAGEGGA